MNITDYEPKSIWKHFDEIRKIPRCSGHEERAREYVVAFAKEHGFDHTVDRAGNTVVRVPATAGHEKAPTVAIQTHLDMVCEKNSGVDHDFGKDAIQLEVKGEWLKAKGTTLGADNGVGVAAALACADDDSVVHGPLELLFTVEEETGLTGAGKLEPELVSAKYLLNLDGEELGDLYIGCAGGGDSTLTLPVTRVDAPRNATAVTVRAAGLRGGHSGVDIHEQRGNAIKVVARLLWEGSRKFPLHLSAIKGGNARNAIPREATADIFVSTSQVEAFRKWVKEATTTIAAELGNREKDMTVSVEDASGRPSNVLDDASQLRVLNLLMAIPHGVDAMNYDIEGLVETSNNLSLVGTEDEQVTIGTSSRSSINTALQAIRDRIRSVGELAGAEVEDHDPYPGWQPNVESDLLSITRSVQKEVIGIDSEPKAIHAGLECGIIGEKFPGMDMISFGPTIHYPHSPDECINLPSVEKFWTLLTAVLKKLT